MLDLVLWLDGATGEPESNLKESIKRYLTTIQTAINHANKRTKIHGNTYHSAFSAAGNFAGNGTGLHTLPPMQARVRAARRQLLQSSRKT